mmetsp:Transcript_5603/g.6501  ORF Transcript_5603/g.6501 Transcript_5603/m.6501 type:complete len:815 (+) Transcript_5603:30-2474(+)
MTRTDIEGLLVEYDVVICGTGLVQSIVASALARAGKSILHCDGNDYYGEMDAVWTLQHIQELLERGKKKNTNNVCVGADAATDDTNDDADDARIGSDDDDDGDDTCLVSLVPDGAQSSLKWHYSYCSSLSSSCSKLDNEYFHFGIRVGSEVKTQYGNGIVRSIRPYSDSSKISTDLVYNIALEIELYKWKLANGQSPIIYVGIIEISMKNNKNEEEDDDDDDLEVDAVVLEDVLSRMKEIRSIQSIEAENLFKLAKRSLALDATPSFVLANGVAVRSIVASGIADYLEFKPLDGLYWLEQMKCNKRKNNTNESFELSRVPCSKNDIFSTKLLAPMEKRRFMKFIQLSMDYATKIAAIKELHMHEEDEGDKKNGDDVDDDGIYRQDQLLEGDEVQSLNERHLNQGRSLARPQNKVVDTDELKLLKEAIESEHLSFDDFLTQKYKLSQKLRSIVRYALAWEIEASSTSLSQGMATLQKHLLALGRYGTTAFLVPMYGSGELSQAFCRSAAVFGATYLLRRSPLAIKVGHFDDLRNTADESDHNKIKNENCVKGIILSKDTIADSSEEDPLQQRKCETKTIKCSHVVLPVNVMDSKYFQKDGRSSTTQRIIRRISLLNGKIIPSDSGEQRHIIFIPPGTMGNSHAIHGVLLDNSVSVAPRGCTLFHLTTTVTDWVGDDDIKPNAKNEDDASVLLERAQASILKSKLIAAASQKPPTEIYYVTFSHECPQLVEAKGTYQPCGIHFCAHTAQELTADAAFEQAQKIFSSICPGAEFMGLSNAINEVIRERVGEKQHDDDEKTMLESALGMIEDNQTTAI